MENTVRIYFDLPEEDHKCLKLMCNELNISIEDFISKLIINAVEDFKYANILTENKEENK